MAHHAQGLLATFCACVLYGKTKAIYRKQDLKGFNFMNADVG